MVPHLQLPLNHLAVKLTHLLEHLVPAPLSASAPRLPVERTRPLPLGQAEAPLPAALAACPVAQKYRTLLGPLDWVHFPERSCDRPWPGPQPDPRAPFVAAFLVKLHEGKRSMGELRTFLIEHPSLVWLLGFPLTPDPSAALGFHVEKSVPSRRQFSRVLRTLSNDALQFLLDSSVCCIRDALPKELAASFGDVIAGDTKHILAWVKENNPKAYVGEGRYDKTRQPKGDADCKLGVKKRHNRISDPSTPTTTAAPPSDTPATPTSEPRPASGKRADAECYWGYASGVVATIVKQWGEVVLAERTRPFNESDIAYFYPLMRATERRLGHRPRFGAWDAAFDAHYVYAYFHQAGGFAAVPLSHQTSRPRRAFDAEGNPLCAAGLAMPLKFNYAHRIGLEPHQRGKHVCPLLYPEPTGQPCPIDDPHFARGGCATTIAASIGARIRWQLDRDSDDYKAVFNQRTVTERINSQAVDLGIERPKLRNGRSIANQNSLTYVLINLRVLQRISAKQPDRAQAEVGPATRAHALTA